MTEETIYTTAIVLLLPLTAGMLVLQVNPYHALVMRGILGAVAALVYALFGAADVALTEALVGTMLSITLYAIAVRSSLSMRVGILNDESNADDDQAFEFILAELRTLLRKYHLRLEPISYSDPQALQTALVEKDVHTTCILNPDAHNDCQIQTRVQRLYDILKAELPPTVSLFHYSAPSTAPTEANKT